MSGEIHAGEPVADLVVQLGAVRIRIYDTRSSKFLEIAREWTYSISQNTRLGRKLIAFGPVSPARAKSSAGLQPIHHLAHIQVNGHRGDWRSRPQHQVLWRPLPECTPSYAHQWRDSYVCFQWIATYWSKAERSSGRVPQSRRCICSERSAGVAAAAAVCPPVNSHSCFVDLINPCGRCQRLTHHPQDWLLRLVYPDVRHRNPRR